MVTGVLGMSGVFARCFAIPETRPKTGLTVFPVSEVFRVKEAHSISKWDAIHKRVHVRDV
jgi:hypothetical protein